jgi:hypothetical protein
VDACEPLAELLATLAAADRANARAVELLARLHATGECEDTTGVAVEVWLLHAGLPATDRRMLDTACVQLGRLPAVADGFARGALSWGQVRTICLLTQRLSDVDAAEFDLRLAPSIDRYADADPDGLLAIARQIVDRLQADQVAAETDRAERDAFVAMQPRLDGNGGRFHGELGGLGFGLVAAALSAGAPLPAGRRELVGQAPAGTEVEDRHRLGRHRADRLVQLCADDLARRGQPLIPGLPLAADAAGVTDASVHDADAATGAGTDALSTEGPTGVDRTRALVPEATLIIDLDQLLGHDQLPVELLTALTGGRLKVGAGTARDWLNEAGCRLRTIVLDDTGQVLGVGRATRHAPGWLEQANRATDATCQAPGCRTAASVCDLDHHAPWHPRRPTDTPGGTDAVNLGPACRTDNVGKHEQGWDVERHGDGTIGWTHPRAGLTVRIVPWATARAAARPHPPHRVDRDPNADPRTRDQRRGRRDRHPPDRRPPDRWRGSPPSPLERQLTSLLTGHDRHDRDGDGHDPPF